MASNKLAMPVDASRSVGLRLAEEKVSRGAVYATLSGTALVLSGMAATATCEPP